MTAKHIFHQTFLRKRRCFIFFNLNLLRADSVKYGRAKLKTKRGNWYQIFPLLKRSFQLLKKIMIKKTSNSLTLIC